MAGFLSKVKLDARPDRVDFRDRRYHPPLVSLPPQYPEPKNIRDFLPAYAPNILNQRQEDSCTGHGLAAVINYIFWERWIVSKAPEKERPALVSPHMLYNNARLYDEWEGEDYGGSSCRGAMKGWYKHGVCTRANWPKETERPEKLWNIDAASRPLGAYCRVDSKSILDIQAAINEVHAVYCSAEVHSGWDNPRTSVDVAGLALKVIKPGGKLDGGHAFALVGYTQDGFIVQNSWGPTWGTGGFALLTYDDWISNGNDAWVAAMGAPMRIAMNEGAPAASQRAGMTVNLAFASATSQKISSGNKFDVPAWSEDEAYEHAIVMGNDGKVIRRLIHTVNAEDNLKFVLTDKIAAAAPKKLAIYVHGGLNSEEDAIVRARRMGPWFEKNGIYPLFVIWRTGLFDALGQIAEDDVKQFEEQVKSIRSKGLGDIVDAVVDRAREAFDRAFEVAAEKIIGKAVWSQIKQNAEMAAITPKAGIWELVERLSKFNGLELHILGHSAGAILLGHLLTAAKDRLAFRSCGLYAPACTIGFAATHYGNAFKNGSLPKSGLHVDLLSDKAETNDSVSAYGKSLLYLVSRALEEKHKTPLLGLEIAWEPSGKGPEMTLNTDLHPGNFAAWDSIKQKFGVGVKSWKGPDVVTRLRPSKTQIKIAHGSFDNDIAVFTASLERILGGKPNVPVTDLSGF